MKRTYYFEEITDENGNTTLTRTNDGFNPTELLGLLELTQLDIINQMRGSVQPDIVKRNVISDEA